MFFFQFSGKIALRGEVVSKLGKDGGVFAARSLEKVSGGDYTPPKISVGLYWYLPCGRKGAKLFRPKKGMAVGGFFPLSPGSRMRLIFQKNSERILPESLLNPARIDYYLSQFPQNSDDFHSQNSHDSHRILQKTPEFCKIHENSVKSSTRILQNPPLEFCNICEASPKSTRIPPIRTESVCQNSADSYRFW